MAHGHKTAHQARMRAHVVLHAARGLSNARIARETGLHLDTVRTWRTRFAEQGLGVWCLSLGVGVLGAPAEDDIARVRPALVAVPGVALAAAVLLASLHSTGAVGRWLWTRRPVSCRPDEP